jgi:hypothetical protein
MKTALPSPAARARLTIALARLALLWAALGYVAFALVTEPAEAAVTEGWVQRYDGGATGIDREDEGRAVAVDVSGNVLVTGASWNGSNFDYYTAKYAAVNGALLWEKRHNGPGNGDDYPSALAVDTNGNVLVTGVSYTAKYAAADGALLWEKNLGGSVAVDASGNVVVAGGSSTAKYAADGALLWEKQLGGGAGAEALAVDKDGNVVVTGSSNGGAPSSGGTSWDYYTAKFAVADGRLIWEKRYNGPGNSADWPSAVAVDGIGNVVVTGYSGFGGIYDYATVKYAAADGALLWEKRYDGPANSQDEAGAVVVDTSGNVVVTGISVGNGTGVDCYTAKYATADGALLWEQRYDGPASGDDSAAAVAVDDHGNVVVTGTSFNASNQDMYTAKYAATDGALLWERRYNGPANGHDYSDGLALGPNGMVAVTGGSYTGRTYTDTDFVTIVYRENLPPVSIAMVPTGVRISFTGVPDHSYNIERAPAITGPWSAIATNTAPASGLIEYHETSPPPGAAFYRTSTP